MPKQTKKALKKVQTRTLQKQRKSVFEHYAKLFAYELPKGFGEPTGKKGRPSTMSEKTLRKLELSFAYDSTVEEACIFAGIPVRTYYDFLTKHPDFSHTVELLRNVPVMIARRTVVNGVVTSQDSAMRYLEKKRKDEFSSKVDLGGGIKLTHDVTPEAAEAIDNVFSLFEKRAREMREDLDQTIADEDADVNAEVDDGEGLGDDEE